MSVLQRVLLFLLNEHSGHDRSGHSAHNHHLIQEHLEHLETCGQLRCMRQLLCVRWAVPPIPENILTDIDSIIQRQRSNRILTLAESIPSKATLTRNGNVDINLLLWQGDITTLAGATAIVNAANSQMLGCFQPRHRCIDNIIHTWAGPRLRAECSRIRTSRARDLDVGEAVATAGFCLPSSFVIHTVGPQLEPDTSPTEEEKAQLASCYSSVLDAAESLPPTRDGRKIIALCGISTGLFAFPAREAAIIAVKTVLEWIRQHDNTTITDVIFNTFTDADHTVYQNILTELPEPWILHVPSDPLQTLTQCDNFSIAREWLNSADYVLVTAGAGLSAATGLDYTSPALFSKYFPGFLKYGLTTLYSVFGFSSWPSEQDRWGYYFTHLHMVRSWPESPLYQTLIQWLGKFGQNVHVRTSNADGFFLKHGWPAAQLSTPQGSYAVLQCLANCRPDATVPSAPLVTTAIASLDPVTQRLNDPGKVPKCHFCGGRMNICVRAGDWFNEEPFHDGEENWDNFRERALLEGENIVILELGAGLSTPGVLRWPNEDFVEEGNGKVKLVRVTMGLDAAVPSELEDQGLAITVDGDITAATGGLFAPE